ncbi:MAG: hypothetical protein ACI9ES_003155 [Oceanospirillaceae bacterium]|jgi:hypothetical protein
MCREADTFRSVEQARATLYNAINLGRNTPRTKVISFSAYGFII